MRTNIEIDDELMKRAMAASGAVTKKAAVEQALGLFVKIKGQQSLMALRGTFTWRGPDDDWATPDPLDPDWIPPSQPTQDIPFPTSAEPESAER